MMHIEVQVAVISHAIWAQSCNDLTSPESELDNSGAFIASYMVLIPSSTLLKVA